MSSTKIKRLLMHEEVFWRSRLNAAFRTGWACFMAGLILQLSSMHSQWVTFPVFSYVMAVSVVGESTFGKAFQDTLGVLKGAIQGAAMPMLVMQIISPKRISLEVAITLIAMSSFIITYPQKMHIMAKRVALAHSGIIYITAVVQREDMDKVYFPLKLAATTIVGAVCGLIALVLPFPRLAMFHVLLQTKLSARITSERLKVMVDAFCVNDPTRASALKLQAKSLAKIGSKIHAEISSKEGDISWERRRIPCNRTENVMHLTKGLSVLQKNLVGMELVLQSDLGCPSKKILHKMLKNCLIYVTDWACLALRHASLENKKLSSMQVIIEEGNEALCTLDEALSTARQKLAYMSSGEIYGDDMGSILGEVLTGGQQLTSELEKLGNYSCPTLESQAVALFFLFNLKKFVEETKKILCNSEHHLGSLSNQLGSSKQKLLRGESLPELREVCKDKVMQLTTSPQDYEALSSTLCKRCATSAAAATSHGHAKDASNQGFFQRLLQRVKAQCVFIKPQPQQLRSAFKMAFAMAIGAFLGFWFNNKKGYWADITLALGFTGPTNGGSFKVATLRALGTVYGSIYGLLVVLATESVPVVRLMALVPWVVFTSFLRESRLFGYSGAISAFTGAIVILARTTKDSSDQEFTVVRIVEAFLGMTSFVVVELLVFPQRAAMLLKTDMIEGLGKLREVVAATVSAYSGRGGYYCEGCSGAALEELRQNKEEVRKAVARQKALLKEAMEEPQFWFEPFCGNVFRKAMEEEEKMTEVLRFVLDAYKEVQKLSVENGIPMETLLYTPLADAMTIIEEKVPPTLDFLAKILQVRSQGGAPPPETATSATEISINSRATDVEAPLPASSRHPFPALQTLMHHEAPTARSSSAFTFFPFHNVAPLREKRIMAAFEHGAHLMVRQLAHHLQLFPPRLPSSPLPPPDSPSCILHTNSLPQPLHIPPSFTSSSSTTIPISSSQPLVPYSEIASNTLFLSLGTLAFTLKRLLHHTTQLEQVIHELLQAENPWNLIDFWDTSKSMGHLWPK